VNAAFTRRESRERRATVPDPAAEEESRSAFWHWFAIGVLLFCWIAEASMCADRGF
jgi:hypothetical protein